MTSINIAAVKTSTTSLLAKAAKMDTNKDGILTGKELYAGKKTAGGDAAVQAIYKLKDSMIGNQWPGAQGSRDVNVAYLKAAAAKGMKQLNAIDSYTGNKSTHKPGNTKDGVITQAEITNYGPGGGHVQRFAAQVVWYQQNK